MPIENKSCRQSPTALPDGTEAQGPGVRLLGSAAMTISHTRQVFERQLGIGSPLSSDKVLMSDRANDPDPEHRKTHRIWHIFGRITEEKNALASRKVYLRLMRSISTQSGRFT